MARLQLPWNGTGEEDYSFDDRLELYEQKGAQAHNIILSTCTETIQRLIEKDTTAKDCWDLLASQYAGNEGILFKYDVWQQFIRTTYAGESAQEFCTAFMSRLDTFSQANIVVPDDIQALQFLGAVDGYFD